MKCNVEHIREDFRKGKKQKFLFFWGHQPSKDGTVTGSCFSQWWNAPFEVNGIGYATAEHWMMVCKAELFNDESTKEKILEAKSPAQAKMLGRQVKGFNAEIWDKHKYDFVKEGNRHKFMQHDDLKTFLLNTKARILVEASPVDAIWGIGLAADDAHINNPLCWKGENLLGFALMEVREELRAKN